MEKVPRELFDRIFFKSSDFRYRLRLLLARCFRIKTKEAKNIILGMRYLDDDECIEHIKRSITVKNNISNIYESLKGSYVRVVSELKILCADDNDNPLYLDIGCNNTFGTRAFANVLGIDTDNIYGVDIDINIPESDDGLNGGHFTTYNGHELHFQENSFDYVSIFQTLHHVNSEDLYRLLHNITRKLKPNGYLIIKEHDAYSLEIKKLIEIEHVLHTIRNNTKYNNLYAKSKDEWNDILQSYGFEITSTFDNTNDATCGYYRLYQLSK